MQWLVMSVAFYLVVAWVRATIEKGKRRRLAEAGRKARRLERPRRKGPPRAEAPEPKAPRGARPPHEVLGVEEDATLEEVQASYRKLAAAYHPDKLASSAAELRAIAEERLREINAAYSTMKREREPRR
jgi:DnaJ-domain-containing protein 1